MSKKQILHFVPDKDYIGSGTPACNAFQEPNWPNLPTFLRETARTRRQVTCGNCKRTKLFRKVR